MASSAQIGALRVSLNLDTAAFNDGLSRVNMQMKAVGQKMAVVGAAMTAVSAGVVLGIKGQLDAADRLGKSAQKIGIPVDELSRLKFAAEQSDVSMETLETSIASLSKKMAGVKDGSQPAIDAFAAVGVSALDAQGNLRPTTEVIDDLANAFAAMPDGPEKTAAALQFGKTWREMIPVLNDGAEALGKIKDQADSLGIVITPEMAENADRFGDAIETLQTQLGGIGTIVAAQLAGPLANLSELVVNVAGAFRDLSPNTQSFIGTATLIGVALGPVVLVLGTLLAVFGPIAIVVGAVAAGIAALTAVVIEFWPEIVAAKDAVIAFGTDALDWIKAKPAEIAEAFRTVVAEMKQIGVDIIAGLWDGLRERWDSVVAGVTGFARSIGDIFRSETETQSPSQVMARIGEDIMAGLNLGMESMQSDVQSGVQSFANGLSNAFASILTEGGSFRDALQSLLSQSIGQVGGGLLSKGIDAIFPVFAAANGTNFAPGGPTLVGERGPELVDLPRGSRVTPNHALGGSNVTVNFAPTINAPGADAAGLALVRQDLAALKNNMRSVVLGVMSDPRARGAI